MANLPPPKKDESVEREPVKTEPVNAQPDKGRPVVSQPDLAKPEESYPLPAHSKKLTAKVVMAALAVLFLLASIPAAVFLVKQKQEIRKQAYEKTQSEEQYQTNCESCFLLDASWQEIADLSTLAVGETINLCARGKTNHPTGITRARFRINHGSWQETTQKRNLPQGQAFCLVYTIPQTGAYTIEAETYNPTLGWR